MTISKKPRGRGAFIVLEGLDRSGKTTQSQALVEGLRKHDVPTEFIRFPDRNPENPLSKAISDYLSSKTELDAMTAHLLFAAQRTEMRSSMEALLAAGTTLVVDRYSYSGIAYSMAKGLDKQWCSNVEAYLPKPDLVVYMEITPDQAALRGGFGEERYETRLFQEKVYQAYQAIKEDNWKVAAATENPAEIAKGLLESALQILDQCQALPLSRQYHSQRRQPLVQRQILGQ
ncbi:putative Thymidylate kinase [Hypsibius exemplaris]|uniref:Thymidylate kinase n=1 Tax=Hypsibius exemplaris TaxID=2072580 RepID=A0A9X6NAS2_HYPEX|nr:putative Thymidylate kinase [Hypsibius exemplaris]